MNNKLVEIVKYNYGMTTKEAKIFTKEMSEERKKLLIDGFRKECRDIFYND